MKPKPVILLCAGGTGGHLFPAEALAHELAGRGYDVHLATDDRAQRFAAKFPASQIHIIKSATPNGRNPLLLAGAAWSLISGYRQSRALIHATKPSAAIGFGGYPTLPPMLAAAHLGVPVLIHDANAVMGRANRWLSAKASNIAMGFGEAASGRKVVVTGNPVRPAVLEAAKLAYHRRKPGGAFNLLVFGGSQGAQFFSQALPQAIALLEPAQRRVLKIVQQARIEDRARLEADYAKAGIVAETAPFFKDMAQRIAKAHFIISRAGASSVSELCAIGRPSLLVPYPFALDHDQAMNAKSLADSGGAQIIAQAALSPQKLAAIIAKAIAEPEALALMAGKARKCGKPGATKRLADLAEQAAGKLAPRRNQQNRK